jgi:hypothetical protein
MGENSLNALRAFFRQGWIDIHACPEFEPRVLVDSRDDRNIPVEMSCRRDDF